MSNQCQKCGKEIEENLLLCEECNVPEPNPTEPVVKEKKKSKKIKLSKPKIIIISIVAIIVLFFGIILSAPDIVSIEVTYEGDTGAGVVLDEKNEGFIVIGTDENGEESELGSWSIDDPQTLVADETASVVVSFGECVDVVEVKCSTSAVKELIVEYTGDREEGTVVTKESSGLKVKALHKNGNESDVTDDSELVKEVKFKADKSVNIQVKYVDPVSGETFEESKKVRCSTVTIESISAKYTGSKAEGIVLDNKNEGIVVTAKYKDGSKEEVKGWKVKEAAALKADKTSKITITYEGKSCTLEVVCSTMSKSAYMAKCKTISYKELARNPKKYEGQLVKFTGEVIQVQEAQSLLYYNVYRIDVTYKGYGYYDDTVYVTYDGYGSEDRVLEDDIVTFYGEFKGLKTYETVMGSSVTIPHVEAEYIVIK